MAADKYLKLDTATGRPTQQAATQSSAGGSDAGKIPALDSTGKLDVTFMPTGIAAETQQCTASEGLTAGMWVNVFNNAGTLGVRKALATDTTKPATGYVVDTVSSSAPVLVYFDGSNALIPVGSFVVADRGKRVFLDPSVSGGCTITPPSTTGQLIQQLGRIVEVGVTYITVAVDFGNEIVA